MSSEASPLDPEDESPFPEEENAELRAAIMGLQAQLDRVRRERDAFAREAEEGRRRLDAVYATRTWRLGRALLWPPYRAKQLARRNALIRRVVEHRRGVRTGPTPPAAAPVPTSERTEVRAAYAATLARTSFSPGHGRVVMAVSSVNLAEGRGDLYTAVGIGRQLERLGYETIYRTPKGWYDLPEHTDLVIALIAERGATFDPSLLARPVRTLAWIRNQTQRWLAAPGFPLFDAVACSSTPTLRAARRVHAGPHLLLPIGVDDELFDSGDVERADVVVATINSWSRERELHRTLTETRLDAPLVLFGRTDGLPELLHPHAAGALSFFAMPSVYQRASLVLDDLQDVNRAYGNVNSRIYESLACGALPIPNAAAGLAEAGLEDLPVAETPGELKEVVSRFRRDPALREALVGRLRDVVMSRHTYAHRARALDDFLSAELSSDKRTVPTVAFAPDYRATNPFQDLLVAKLGQSGLRALPTESPMALVRTGAVDPKQLVYHRHWTATLLGPAVSRRDAEERCTSYLAELDQLRALGGRIVWTVHNALPHECRFPDIERRLRQGLADRAHVIHVMCARTPEMVRHVVQLPPERTVVLEHGSYVDVYPNVIDPRQARLELGIDPDDLVLLSLGGIRPYRGIDALLDAFAEAVRHQPRLRLIVAGRPGRDASVPELARRCAAHPRITPYFEAVPDDDLQVFFGASDVAVYTHRSVLNSGGVLLALSFGRPVIAPATGCLPSVIDESVGILYTPDDASGLSSALRRAGTLAGTDVRRSAFARAGTHTHLDMAEGYARVVNDLLSPSPTESLG